MASRSLKRWTRQRARYLGEIAQAQIAASRSPYAVGAATQAYIVLLAGHFQGFARDLHSECVDHLLWVLAPPPPLLNLARAEFTRGRQLDRGNAQPSSLGADFGRFDIDLWDALKQHDPQSVSWKHDLELLNEWRNAVAHQDFTSSRLPGRITSQAAQVNQWRSSCKSLARAMDAAMYGHMQAMTGAAPW